MQQWINSQILIESILSFDLSPNNLKGISQYLNQIQNKARIYEIDKKISRMFLFTHNQPRKIELPFPIIFLSTPIKFKKATIEGLLLIKVKEDVLIRIVISEKDIKDVGLWNIWLNKKEKKQEKEMKKIYNENMTNIIRWFVMNFNDFLEHPEIIIREKVRTNQQQRIKRNKLPLPNSSKIMVKGELKIYVNSMQPKKGENNDISKCYEVAGHWRRYRNERYKMMRGKKQFIHPYIKGSGILNNKIRKLSISKTKRRNAGMEALT